MSARPPSARSNRAHGSTAVVAWNAGWTFFGAGLGVANAVRHRVRGYRTPRTFSPTDVERNVDYVLGVVDTWRQAGLDPGGRRILEIGPGPDLGTGLALLALGASTYVAVDRFPLALSETEQFRTALGERLGVDVRRLSSRATYVVGSIPDVDLEAGFDAIVSNAALEHLPDVPAAFSWMCEVGGTDATHIHVVDPQTHTRWLRTRDPWNILRYPAWFYDRAMAFPGIPNRLLASDYVAAAGAVGLRLSVVDGVSVDDAYVARIRPYLPPAFRGRPQMDLKLRSFNLVSGHLVSPPPPEDESTP